MDWIFLSPHFDDIALSCGGLLWELSQSGHGVEICTVCSGKPPADLLSPFAESLHARWAIEEQAVSSRQSEDQASCAVLGARWRYIGIPDCIYRPGGSFGHYYYASEESLFGALHPAETALVAEVADRIQAGLSAGAQIIAPLTLGGHVDHQLTRQAAEQLPASVLYYADYPYLLQETNQLAALSASGWRPVYYPVSQTGLAAWQNAIAAHASQISTFWPHLDAMRDAIRSLWETNAKGAVLWIPPGRS